MGRIIITEEELDQSIFQFGHSKEGVLSFTFDFFTFVDHAHDVDAYKRKRFIFQNKNEIHA